MNNQKRSFLHWANFANNQKKILMVKGVFKFFNNLNQISSSNNSFFLTTDFLQEKKIKHLLLLMNNFKLRLKDAFERWNKNVLSKASQINNEKNKKKNHNRVLRHANQHVSSKEILKVKKILNLFNNYANEKLSSKSKFQNLFSIFSNLIKRKLKLGFSNLIISKKTQKTSNCLLLALQNLRNHKLHLAFSAIKTVASNDLVKAYCNTLWKWKLANVKAGFEKLERKFNRVNEKNRINKIETFKKIMEGKFNQKFNEFKHNSTDLFWKENFFYLHIAAKLLNFKKMNLQRTAFLQMLSFNQNQKNALKIIKMNDVFSNLINKRKFSVLISMYKQNSPNNRISQFILNLQTLSKKALRSTYNKLKTNSRLNKQSQIHKGIISLIRMAKPFRRAQMIHCWNMIKEYSPAFPKIWYKKAVNILAKHSTLNRQIAIWRLRDNIHVSGVYLSAPKIVKCKKMFNNIRILYERTITKAFYSIERAGTGESRIYESKVQESRSKIQDAKLKIPGSKMVVSEIYKSSTSVKERSTDYINVIILKYPN